MQVVADPVSPIERILHLSQNPAQRLARRQATL